MRARLFAMCAAVWCVPAVAKLPVAPEFVVIPPASLEVRLANRFQYRCAPGILPTGGATLFVDRNTTTELTWKPAAGVFLPGDWTCYVDAIWDMTPTEPASWAPTNRVSFAIVAQPLPKAAYRLEVTRASDPLADIEDRI